MANYKQKRHKNKRRRKLQNGDSNLKKKPSVNNPSRRKKCKEIFGSFCKSFVGVKKRRNQRRKQGKKGKGKKKVASWNGSVYGSHSQYKIDKPIWDENDRNKKNGKGSGKGSKSGKGGAGKGGKAGTAGGLAGSMSLAERMKLFKAHSDLKRKNMAGLAGKGKIGAKDKSSKKDKSNKSKKKKSKSKLDPALLAAGAGALAGAGLLGAAAAASKSKKKEEEKSKHFDDQPWELGFDPREKLEEQCFGFELTDAQFKNVMSQETYANSTSTIYELDVMEPYVTTYFPNEAPKMIFFPIKTSLLSEERKTPESEVKHYNFIIKEADEDLYNKREAKDLDAVAAWDEWAMYKNRLFAAIEEVKNLRLLNYERTCEEEDPFEPRPEEEEPECEDESKKKKKKSKGPGAGALAAAGLGAGLLTASALSMKKQVGDGIIKQDFNNDAKLKKDFDMSLEERRRKMRTYDKEINNIKKKHRKGFRKEQKAKKKERKKRKKSKKKRKKRGKLGAMVQGTKKKRPSKNKRRKSSSSKKSGSKKNRRRGSQNRLKSKLNDLKNQSIKRGNKSKKVIAFSKASSKSPKRRYSNKSKLNTKRLKKQETPEPEKHVEPIGKRKGRNKFHKYSWRFGDVNNSKKRILEAKQEENDKESNTEFDEKLEQAIFERIAEHLGDVSHLPNNIDGGHFQEAKLEVKRGLIMEILKNTAKQMLGNSEVSNISKALDYLLPKETAKNASKPNIKERNLSALSTLFNYFHHKKQPDTKEYERRLKASKCKTLTPEEKKKKEEEKKKKDAAEEERKANCAPRAEFESFWKKASEELKKFFDFKKVELDSLTKSTHIKESPYIPKYYGCAYYFEKKERIHLFYWRKGMRRIHPQNFFSDPKKKKIERMKSLTKNVKLLNKYGYVVSDIRADMLGFTGPSGEELMLAELPSLIRNNTENERVKTLTRQSAPELLKGANRGTPYLWHDRPEKQYYNITADLFSLAHMMHQTYFGFQIYTGLLDPYLQGYDFSEPAVKTFQTTQIQTEAFHYMDLSDAEKAQAANDPELLKQLAEENDRMVEYRLYDMEKNMFDFDPEKRPTLDEVEESTEEAEDLQDIRGEKPLAGADFKNLGLVEMIAAIADTIVSMVSAMGMDVMQFLIGGFIMEFLAAILAVLGTNLGASQKSKKNEETQDGPVNKDANKGGKKRHLLERAGFDPSTRYQLERLANIVLFSDGTKDTLLSQLRNSSDFKMARVADVLVEYKKKLEFQGLKSATLNRKNSMESKQHLKKKTKQILVKHHENRKKRLNDKKVVSSGPKKVKKKALKHNVVKSIGGQVDRLKEAMMKKYSFNEQNVGLKHKPQVPKKKKKKKKMTAGDRIFDKMKKFYNFDEKRVKMDESAIKNQLKKSNLYDSWSQEGRGIKNYTRKTDKKNHRKLVIDSVPKSNESQRQVINKEKQEFLKKFNITSTETKKDMKIKDQRLPSLSKSNKSKRDQIEEEMKKKYQFDPRKVGITSNEQKVSEQKKDEIEEALKKKYEYNEDNIGIKKIQTRKPFKSNEKIMNEMRSKYKYNENKIGIKKTNDDNKENIENETLKNKLKRKYAFNPNKVGIKHKSNMNIRREQMLQNELEQQMKSEYQYDESKVGLKNKQNSDDLEKKENNRIANEMKSKWNFDQKKISQTQQKMHQKKSHPSYEDKLWNRFVSNTKINPDHIGLNKNKLAKQRAKKKKEEENLKKLMKSKWQYDDSKIGLKNRKDARLEKEKEDQILKNKIMAKYSYNESKVNKASYKKHKSKQQELQEFKQKLKNKYFGKKDISSIHSSIQKKRTNSENRNFEEDIDQRIKKAFSFNPNNIMKTHKKKQKNKAKSKNDFLTDFKERYSFNQEKVGLKPTQKKPKKAKVSKNLSVEDEKKSFLSRFESYDESKINAHPIHLTKKPKKPKKKESIESQKKRFLKSISSFSLKV